MKRMIIECDAETYDEIRRILDTMTPDTEGQYMTIVDDEEVE